MKYIDIFYYGLFMDPDLLHAQGYKPNDPIVAKLDNFDLILGERATLKAKDNCVVWGAILRLSEDEITDLYAAPSVSDYKAVNIICQDTSGQDIKAAVYILPENYSLMPPTDTNYAKKLFVTCKKLSLPPTYCNKISEMIKAIEDERSTNE